jgi:hypothetical protein
MFVLGHVGIGPRLLLGLRRRLPAGWLALGCLLPDLIDKPLFYGLLWTEGHADALIAGSRSIGHSGLFFLLLLGIALLVRRPAAWAVFAGVATHLALDVLGELIMGAEAETSIWLAILFPALGWQFPRAYFSSMLEHLRISAASAYVVAGELLGGALLIRGWLSRGRQSS